MAVLRFWNPNTAQYELLPVGGNDEIYIGPDDPGTSSGYELWYDTDAPDPVGFQGKPGPNGPAVPSSDPGNAIVQGTDGLLYTSPPFLILEASDPVPGGTPVGTIIIRKV
jgi:hypothetical protein